MRGEHCVAGASILSAIAVILLVFANIGQISSGGLTNSIYLAEVNVAAYGAAVQSVSNNTAGLYDTDPTDKLGTRKGLRQYYRYGLYNACGYQKNGTGICNSTIFGYPMEPLSQLQADLPKDSFKKQLHDIIGKDSRANSFKDNGYNHGSSRAGSLMIFVGSALVLVAFVFGLVKARIFFLVAAACAGIGAVLLLIGASLWTALIAKDGWLKIVKVQYGASLGIQVNAGPSLYLVWVAFALVLLSVLPYVVACCTFRRN